MTEFRTKGRGRNRQVYPVSEGKTYRRNYNSDPSFFTKGQIHQDVKATRRNDDPLEPSDHGKEHDIYKRKIVHEADKQYLKESKKENRKQKRAIKKEEKLEKKSMEAETKQQLEESKVEAKKEYHEDQESEAEDRELAAKIDGRDGDLG